MHNGNMIEGALIAKALTLEPNENSLADSADERESAQRNENKGTNVRLAAEELANVELLTETTSPVTLVVPQDDEDEEETDNP